MLDTYSFSSLYFFWPLLEWGGSSFLYSTSKQGSWRLEEYKFILAESLISNPLMQKANKVHVFAETFRWLCTYTLHLHYLHIPLPVSLWQGSSRPECACMSCMRWCWLSPWQPCTLWKKEMTHFFAYKKTTMVTCESFIMHIIASSKCSCSIPTYSIYMYSHMCCTVNSAGSITLLSLGSVFLERVVYMHMYSIARVLYTIVYR